MLDPRNRTPWLLVAGSALALEALSLYFQYGMRLDPCVLCIYQRVAVLGLLGAGLLGALQPRWPALRLVGYGVLVTSSVLGLRFAYQQVGVLRGAHFECSFLPDFPTWLPLHEWVPAVFQPTGLCGELDWYLLGFTMPEVMVGVFLAYLAALLVALAGEWQRIGRPSKRLHRPR